MIGSWLGDPSLARALEPGYGFDVVAWAINLVESGLEALAGGCCVKNGVTGRIKFKEELFEYNCWQFTSGHMYDILRSMR